MAGTAIPVVMYHSVGHYIPDWQWSRRLTIEWRVFEDHLRWLKRAGYRTADLNELHDHVAGKRPLPAKSVVLTFDDGYVDNWTFAVPLLREYGMSATVLVPPDFVDPRDNLRPTLDDVRAGRANETDMEVRGFMSWPELRAASESGVLSVQSHAMTHTWYPCGPRVVDFHHPGDGHYWLDWNQDPGNKPFYLRDPDNSAVAWGTPVYEHKQSLQTRRYFPPLEENEVLTAHVAANGGEHFFARPEWRSELENLLVRARSDGSEGRYESDDERRARCIAEMEDSRRIIEDRVGRPVEFLIWPTHAYDGETMALARERFKSVTVTADDAGGGRNRPGEDPAVIVRMGVPLIPSHGRMLAPGGRYLVAYMEEFCGNVVSRSKRMLLKRLYKLRAALAG